MPAMPLEQIPEAAPLYQISDLPLLLQKTQEIPALFQRACSLSSAETTHPKPSSSKTLSQAYFWYVKRLSFSHDVDLEVSVKRLFVTNCTFPAKGHYIIAYIEVTGKIPGRLVTTKERGAGVSIGKAYLNCASQFVALNKSHRIIYSLYRQKGAVHISHSYIPMADWSQFDSPAYLLTMVMASSTKTYTAFWAIFMLIPAFMAQAAPSLHPSLHQLNCAHGEHFLPASPSSAASVSVSSPPSPCLPFSCACPWLTGSSKLERFLLLTFQSTFQSFLCWEPRQTLRKQAEQFCLPFIGSPQEADEWR